MDRPHQNAPLPERPATLTSILATVGLVHLCLLFFMVLVHLNLSDARTLDLEGLRNALVHWDAHHYLTIAQQGYHQDYLLVFFPLFPLLLRAAASLGVDPLFAALVLNFFFHLGGGYYLYKLVRLDYTERTSSLALLFYLVYPASFIHVAPYTEALFLFGSLSSIYYFRKGQYLASSILAGLTSLTRITGLLLAALFALEALLERKDLENRRWIAPILAPCLGFGTYLLINLHYGGSPFHFLDVQLESFQRAISLPHRGFYSAWVDLNGQWPEKLTKAFANLLGGILAWVVAGYTFFKIRKSYGVYCLLTAILITFQSWWQSLLRYDAALFPLYIMLAFASRSRLARVLLLTLSTTLLALFAMEYARGRWAM